jgi:uncharacterized protein YpiB (UPF0302 family)
MELISIIASLSGLFIAGANCAIFIIIKFNDMKHQEEALKRIEKNQEGMDKKLDKFGERIATIEGKCAANHKF